MVSVGAVLFVLAFRARGVTNARARTRARATCPASAESVSVSRFHYTAFVSLVLGCTSGHSIPASEQTSLAPGLRLEAVDELCAVASPDTDEDGLSDGCELGLGRSFAPVLVVADRDCSMDSSVSPPRLGGEYYFGVQQTAREDAVRIAYLPAYYRDCGWRGIKCWLPFVNCAPHTGDSETIIVEVERDPESLHWRTRAIFLSAHCFGRSTADCRWYRGADLAEVEWSEAEAGGAPVVWVAAGRQANYLSRERCDRGHSTIDTCDHNHLRYRFPIESQRQNVGSRRRPVGSEGGCVDAEHIGWGSRLPDVGVVECFWDSDRPFRGWQADTIGTAATPYARYLDEIAGF